MQRDVAALAGSRFDVLVVGGGIHGAWIALRAQRAGYRVALIEQGDFGAATSANSLKILHGGLRYLQHADLARVRSSVRARRAYAQLAPELVRPLSCVMPLAAVGVRSPWILGPALLANDLLSIDRNRGVEPPAQLPHGRLLGRAACAAELAPLIATRAVAGAQWSDAIALDSARLVLEPLLAAAAAGAVLANYVRACDYLQDASGVHGVEAIDQRTGRELQIRADVVVDATGPWAGRWARNRSLPAGLLPTAWLGAINLVLRRSLGTNSAIALPSTSGAADRSALLRRSNRELFFVPWRQRTLIGTQYHEVGDIEAARGAPAEVVRRFIEEAAAAAPLARLSADDILNVHWGLLPAEDRDHTVPRKSPVLASGRSQTGAAGLIVVIGEKLTSAPMLSLAVLDRLRAELGREPAAPLRRDAEVAVDAARLKPGAAAEPPALDAQIVRAIRDEMALTLDDLLLRRMGFADDAPPSTELLLRIARIAAPLLDWTPADQQQQIASFALRSHVQAGIGSI